MANSKFKLLLGTAVVSALAVGFAGTTSVPSLAGDGSKSQGEMVPVETDLHEYMEYMNQPHYLQLKQELASEPANGKAWVKVKSAALVLAEGGNLLMLRKPEENAAEWVRYSKDVRDDGSKLYRAGLAKDYKQARMHYEAMLKDCNACHDQFAGGEYQLKP